MTKRTPTKVASPSTADTAPPRARLVGDTLELDDETARAWRRIGLALDRAGFTVENRDRSAGTYTVRFVPPGKEEEKSPNFFQRMFGAKSDEYIRRYRIVVKPSTTENKSNVVVQKPDESPDTSEAAQRILSLLRDELK